MKEEFKNIRDSIAESYSQVFFSNNKWLACLLMLASFINPQIGLSGIISVITGLLILRISGFNPAYIKSGVYTYNLLLTGFGIGAYFQFNITFILVLLITAFFTLLLTVWLASFTAKYNLPFLSFPFIFGIWVVLLNAQTFSSGLLLKNDDLLVKNYPFFIDNSLIDSIRALVTECFHPIGLLYFKSLSSIFFQHDILAGVIISLGLLIYSRIAFILSWFGFICGYLFFKFQFGDMDENAFIIPGFNYIFSALALGGFFLIPSLASFGLVVLATPIIGFSITALGKFVAPYDLPLYSLPFSVCMILFLTALQNRYHLKYLHLVQYQLFSPEKNLYAFKNYRERFQNNNYHQVHLPFYGEWFISQGHEGDKTHKADYRFAWDFVVNDEHQKTFRFPGEKVSDFYCYALPVIAPADGTVIKIQDNIADNGVGDVNLAENWGNTIIIKHSDYLFSKISHIKSESFKVKEGDYVSRGELLALCGNSGRSPEPHIHFQLQSTAFIGAKTLKYPISYFLSKTENTYQLHSFEYPEEGMHVMRPVPSYLLQQAFYFIPGMKLQFNVNDGKNNRIETWEVFTDISNHSYLYCAETASTAYFTNNGTLFYFSSFTGDKKSLLYYFYLGAYKVLMSYVPGLEVKDQLSIETNYSGFSKVLQDIIAPFYIYLKPSYTATFKEADNEHAPSRLTLESKVYTPKNRQNNIDFKIELSENSIQKIIVNRKGLCITAENISS